MMDLTQKELGDAVGVAQGTVCNWEIGKIEPTLHRLRLLAAALDVKPDDLLGRVR